MHVSKAKHMHAHVNDCRNASLGSCCFVAVLKRLSYKPNINVELGMIFIEFLCLICMAVIYQMAKIKSMRITQTKITIPLSTVRITDETRVIWQFCKGIRCFIWK